MKIQDLIERVGGDSSVYGRIIEYLKDGIEELEMRTEQHIKTSKQDVVKDQRDYHFPHDVIKVTDIQIKGHRNNDNEYRSIPRMIDKPMNKDDD